MNLNSVHRLQFAENLENIGHPCRGVHSYHLDQNWRAVTYQPSANDRVRVLMHHRHHNYVGVILQKTALITRSPPLWFVLVTSDIRVSSCLQDLLVV